MDKRIILLLIIVVLIFSIYGIIDIMRTIASNNLNTNFFGTLKGSAIATYSPSYTSMNENATINGIIFKDNNMIGEYINWSIDSPFYSFVYLYPNGSVDYIVVEDSVSDIQGIYTEQNISQYINIYFKGLIINNNVTKETTIDGLPSICYMENVGLMYTTLTGYMEFCFLTVKGEITPIITHFAASVGNSQGKSYIELNISSIKYNVNNNELPKVIVVNILNDNDTSPENLSIILNSGTNNEYICNYTFLDPLYSINNLYNCILPEGPLYSVEVNISSPPGHLWQIQLIYPNGTIYNCVIDRNILCPPGYNISTLVV